MIEKHLAYKDFDYSIDIHGGGADLIFPHHENEASQSRCFSGRELAKYWMHNGFVRINGEKMSKSLGNSFFVKDALKIYSGELLRFYLLSTHYRQDFNFSEEELLNSKKRLDKLYRLKKRVFGGKPGKVDIKFKNNILEALEDDLNVSVALAKIDNFISNANDELDNKPTKNLKKVILANIDFIDEVLGFGGENPFTYFQFGVPEKLKTKIEQLITERTEAKKNKDFDKADKIRDELKKLRVSIMDTPNGTVWEK
jgi:cysteinyl-tRNA synthetase